MLGEQRGEAAAHLDARLVGGHVQFLRQAERDTDNIETNAIANAGRAGAHEPGSGREALLPGWA
jgi:hypothetical protein